MPRCTVAEAVALGIVQNTPSERYGPRLDCLEVVNDPLALQPPDLSLNLRRDRFMEFPYHCHGRIQPGNADPAIDLDKGAHLGARPMVLCDLGPSIFDGICSNAVATGPARHLVRQSQQSVRALSLGSPERVVVAGLAAPSEVPTAALA